MPLGEEDLESKIIIRNYPFSCSELDLRIMFEKYGPVADLFSPKSKEENKPRGFTFCQYKRKEDAIAAINGMDGREIQGRKISVEKCRIPRPVQRGRGPPMNRSRERERRRSRSPVPRRFDRSRSRERGRNRPRSRDRGFQPRDGFRRSPPPFDMPFPPNDFSRAPMGGGPMPPSRSRGGLLDPPVLLGSDRGAPMGPPRGMRDEPPPRGRDSYGPPPSRGGFSGSYGPSSSNYRHPSPGRKAPFDDPYYHDHHRSGTNSGYSSQDYNPRPSHDPPPSGGRDYPYDNYSSSQPRDSGFSSYNNNSSGSYNSSGGQRSSYGGNQSKSDYGNSYYEPQRGQSSYDSSSNRGNDHYSSNERSSGVGYSSGSPGRGYDSLGYGSSRGMGGGGGSSFSTSSGPGGGGSGFSASSGPGRGGSRNVGYSAGRGDGFAGSPTNPKVGYSSFSGQRPATQGYPGQEYKPGPRY